jgi:hypothetical protein
VREQTGERERTPAWAALLRPARNPSTTIYGTLVAAALVAGEGDADVAIPIIIGTVLLTLVVYWLAHVYADLLAPDDHAERPGHPTRHELLVAMADEWGHVAGGLGPAAALLLAWLFRASTELAVDIALGVAVAELAGWGVLAARKADLHGAWMLLYAFLAAVLGGLIVVLKVLFH